MSGATMNPCPCGCRDEDSPAMRISVVGYGVHEREHFQVESSCGVRGPLRDTREAAVEAWNRLSGPLEAERGAPDAKS